MTACTRPVGLRVATRSDLPEILRLESCCFAHDAERFHRRQIASLLCSVNAHARVLTKDHDELAGWGLGLIRRASSGRVAGRLYALAIDRDCRGHGLGRQLTNAILQAMMDAGAQTLSLEVRPDNTSAIALYRSLGFIQIAQLPDYYALGQNAIRMRKG